jgi:peptidoglycan/LPS O-acetylase OafA/YrhL
VLPANCSNFAQKARTSGFPDKKQSILFWPARVLPYLRIRKSQKRHILNNTTSLPAKKPRLSNFELLRLVSILLIATMHSMGFFFQTGNVVNRETVVLINSLANIGVTMFVLISGYFGIRFKMRRLIEIVGMVWFYAVLNFCVECFCLHKGITVRQLIPYFVPVLCKKYWFITCYVVLYCFSSYLNRACEALKKTDFQRLLLIFGAFFLVAPTVLVFYEITDDMGKGVINMTLMYLVGRYLRLYGFPTFISRRPWLTAVLAMVVIFLANSVLSMGAQTVVLRFARDNSIFIMIEAVCVFYLFSRWHFTSRTVNVLAGFVFGIYLCHNTLLEILRPWYAADIESLNIWPRLAVALTAAIVGSLVVEEIRRVLVKICGLPKASERILKHYEQAGSAR